MHSSRRVTPLGVLVWLLVTSGAVGSPAPTSAAESALQGTCVPSSTVLCLQSNRFSVEIDWEDFMANTGAGQVGAQLSDDTGYFYFTDPELPELFIRVLDGTAINTFWWVFGGGLSNWEYTVTVTDTTTAQQAVYFNPLGSFSTMADTSALPGSVPALPTGPVDRQRPVTTTLAAGDPTPCAPGATTLCLDSQRFSVEVAWEDFSGMTGNGQAQSVTDKSGYFAFFAPNNVDLMVKILDGGDGNFWFYSCAPTDVAYTVTVTDICTGSVRQYVNPLASMSCFGDFAAFPSSPNCTPIFEDGFESGDTSAWD